jgi:guanylate kinase
MSINKGILFIISGTSGSGKTTIGKEVIKRLGNEIRHIATYTTRKIRSNEVDGEDYNFLSAEEFEVFNANDFFIETVQINGNMYGTPKKTDGLLKKGESVLIIINRDGVEQFRKLYEKTFTIWIDCDDKTISERLKNRNKSTEEFIQSRIAINEMERAAEKDSPQCDIHLSNLNIKKTISEALKFFESKMKSN